MAQDEVGTRVRVDEPWAARLGPDAPIGPPTVVDAIRTLRAALDQAFRDADKRRIAEIAVTGLATEALHRHPSIRVVWLDWNSGGGLWVSDLFDGTGARIDDRSLADDLGSWISDIRPSATTHLTRLYDSHGPFQLDLTPWRTTT